MKIEKVGHDQCGDFASELDEGCVAARVAPNADSLEPHPQMVRMLMASRLPAGKEPARGLNFAGDPDLASQGKFFQKGSERRRHEQCVIAQLEEGLIVLLDDVFDGQPGDVGQTLAGRVAG